MIYNLVFSFNTLSRKSLNLFDFNNKLIININNIIINNIINKNNNSSQTHIFIYQLNVIQYILLQ